MAAWVVSVLLTLIVLWWKVEASPVVPGLSNRDCYAQRGDLYIGGLFRLTKRSPPDSGQFCSDVIGDVYRVQYVEAGKLAIDLINRDADILPNVTLGFVITDTCGLDLAALGQTTYFLASDGKYLRRPLSPTCANGPPEVPIVGVVGPSTSREAVLAASVASSFQIPIIGTTATSDELSDKNRFKYFLRMVPPDKFQVEAIMDMVARFNWTYVSLLYADGSYGAGAAKAVLLNAKIHGICLPITDAISPHVTVDEMRYHVRKLHRHKEARVVLLFLGSSQLRVLFETVLLQGLQGLFIWVSGDSMVNTDHGIGADGAFVMHHVLPKVASFNEYVLSLTPDNNPQNPWMRRHWEVVYNCKWPTGNETEDNSCETYSDVPKLDIRLAGYAATVMNSLYAMAYGLHNLITNLCPEAFHDQSLLEQCIDGSTLLQYLRELTFIGVGGEVIRFDENGDMMGRFTIKQYTVGKDAKYTQIALWDKEAGTFDIYDDKIDWSVFSGMGKDDGTQTRPESVCSKPCNENQYVIQRELPCCWDCHKCRSNERVNVNKTGCELCESFSWPDELTQSSCSLIDPSYPQFSDTSTLAMLALGVIGAFGALAVIGWYLAHWSHKLVKASSRQLTSILLIGSLLAFLTVFSFFARPDLLTCSLSRYGFFFSVTLIYAPLAVKTNRIFRIFSAGKKGTKKPAAIGNRSQVLFTALLIVIEAGMSVLSGVLAMSNAKLRMPVATEKFVELYCNLPLVALLPPLSFNILLVCVCAVYGFLTRKLPENFNESWYIFVSVATTLFLWLVFLPTYFTAFYASHQVVLLASCLLINAAVTLGCLFVPKIYAIHFMDENQLKVEAGNTSTVATENTTDK